MPSWRIGQLDPHTTTGFSPARLMMGREMRDSVPILTRKLVPEWPASHVVRQKDERAKQEQKFYHDRRHGVHPLTMLHPGDQVRVKLDTQRQWSEPVTVVQEHETPQSYVVASPMGDRRRNRKHLQKIPVGELDQSVGADEEPTGEEPSSDTCDTKTVQEPRTSKRSMRRPKRLIEEV